RNTELRAAQAYLSKAGSISDADVQGMLERFNATVFQFSAQLADTFPYESVVVQTDRTQDQINVFERVVGSVGRTLTQTLASAGDQLDPVLIQIAAQSCMARCAFEAISSWSFGTTEIDKTFASVHDQLLRTEPQVVAARWRALARKSARTLSEAGDSNVAALRHHIVGILGEIFTLCGLDGEAEPYTLIADNYGNRLQGIVHQLLDLRKAIGEDVIASELVPLYVYAEEVFHPDVMLDLFASDGLYTTKVAQDEKILCTVELGLERVDK
ncbi:hypothetical protein OBBRIDRAFT_696975, partial [Obba rivulosa]